MEICQLAIRYDKASERFAPRRYSDPELKAKYVNTSHSYYLGVAQIE